VVPADRLPLQALLLLVVFAVVCQMAGSTVLIAGVLLLTAGPLVYVVYARPLVQALGRGESRSRLARPQRLSDLLTLAGTALLLVYLTTTEVGPAGRRLALVGLREETSLVQPWERIPFLMEYFGRLLLTTLVMTDVFLLMSASVWHQARRLAGSTRSQESGVRSQESEKKALWLTPDS